MAGEEPGEQRRAHAADVEVPGGARREAGLDGHGERSQAERDANSTWGRPQKSRAGGVPPLARVAPGIRGCHHGSAMNTVLDSLFPPGAATVLSLAAGEAGALTPVELGFTATFAPVRLAEFRHGRACARLALGRIGAGAHDIPVGASREPIWPTGVVGSISHAGTAAAAVVAWQSDDALGRRGPRARDRAGAGADDENLPARRAAAAWPPAATGRAAPPSSRSA